MFGARFSDQRFRVQRFKVCAEWSKMKEAVTKVVCRWVAAGVFVLAGSIVLGQEPVNPLQPPDRSTPRAALETFLKSGDAFASFLALDYLPSPSRHDFSRLFMLGDHLMRGVDLSQVAPAAHMKVGIASSIALYETLCRIPLPSWEDIPGTNFLAGSTGTNDAQWVVPNTEIVLVRAQKGPHSGQFLFSAETVAKADDFYARVRTMPYLRPVPLDNINDILVTGGGWMVPYRWIRSAPSWLRIPMAGQAAWKWIALALLLGVFCLFLVPTFRLSRRGGPEHPFLMALAQLALPSFLLVAAPVLAYFALVQINMRDHVGAFIQLTAAAVFFIAAAWIAWRASLVVAEAIIASPRISPESIDAHLIRICTRLFGMVAGVGLLVMGADRLGMPVLGIVAGLGVGGLAIALAAQPTIENLIGSLSLYGDKPIRVGDLCRCGTDEGTVEGIGLRSTRIRGLDRSLTTIPNAVLSKMPIVNFAQRDRMLIQVVLGVRYETSQAQMRQLLAAMRDMLLGHPRIVPDPVRVRFVGFGTSTLDIEVYAYVATRDKGEFLAIREDILLQIMDIVEKSGTGFAFPSQTLYFSRDQGVDAGSLFENGNKDNRK
jgi:MscS family membrane protein